MQTEPSVQAISDQIPHELEEKLKEFDDSIGNVENIYDKVTVKKLSDIFEEVGT